MSLLFSSRKSVFLFFGLRFSIFRFFLPRLCLSLPFRPLFSLLFVASLVPTWLDFVWFLSFAFVVVLSKNSFLVFAHSPTFFLLLCTLNKLILHPSRYTQICTQRGNFLLILLIKILSCASVCVCLSLSFFFFSIVFVFHLLSSFSIPFSHCGSRHRQNSNTHPKAFPSSAPAPGLLFCLKTHTHTETLIIILFKKPTHAFVKRCLSLYICIYKYI